METPKKNPIQSKSVGFGQLESLLEQYLVQKAPALPTNIKELIVNFAPWLMIIAIVLALPAIFALLGLGWFYAPFAWGSRIAAQVSFTYTLAILFLAVTLIMRILALPGLFARSRSGWKLVYYSVLINAVYSLLSYQIVSCLIGTLLGLYFVFQVKSYYK